MATKVCHVTSLHKANDGRIFQRYCKSLAKKYEVYLVAPNTEDRVLDGVHIVGVSLPGINSRVKRWMNLNKLLPVLDRIDAEVYHFHDPELLKLGLKMKKKGKKIVFDSHEDVVNQIKNKGFIPKSIRKLIGSLYEAHERRCLKQYTAVVSVTGYIVDRLKKINPNTYQITNYPILSDRGEIVRPWDRSVCFAGLLSRFWLLEEIIDVLPTAQAHMYMAGFYANEVYLNKLKELEGWKNVEFFGTLPHNKVLELYHKSSIGLAIESYDDPNVGYRTGSLGVTKIPDYMASGLPIIVSDSVVWGEMVRKYKCGMVVEDPENKEEILGAINYILDHPEVAKEMSYNSKKAAENEFNWNSQEKVLYKMYDAIIG